MKPKGVLVLKKFQILCQKSPGKSSYSELMYKRYCLYPQGYTVQRHLCLIEGVSLPLEARKGFLAQRNLLKFHYTLPNAINFTDIKALWSYLTTSLVPYKETDIVLWLMWSYSGWWWAITSPGILTLHCFYSYGDLSWQ